MRRPLTWSIAAGTAACLILLLRCKNRAKAHKFNPSKLQNHDSFSSDLVLHLSRKLRKYQPQGSPLQPPAAPYVPSRCRKLRQRGGVLRNRGLLNGRSRRNIPEPLRRRCLQYEYLLGRRVLIRSTLRLQPLRGLLPCYRTLSVTRFAPYLSNGSTAPPLCRGVRSGPPQRWVLRAGAFGHPS